MHNSYYYSHLKLAKHKLWHNTVFLVYFQPFSQSGIIKNIKFKVQNVHPTSSWPRVCHLGKLEYLSVELKFTSVPLA